MIQLYNNSCDELLPKFVQDNQKFDLILTDPPYNIGKDFGNDTDKLSLNEFLAIIKDRLKLLDKLLTDNGSIVWFCSHIYLGYLQCLMYEMGWTYQRILIWYYNNGMSRQTKTPISAYEPILWFTKSNKKWTYNKDDVRVPYKTERVKNPVYKKDKNGVKKAWIPNPNGALRNDVFEFPVLAGKLYENERTEHPTQKPESLITELVKAFCPKDGRVLDPFMGSGTTPAVCNKLNIDCVGIELEEKWYNIAKNRIGVS